MKTSLFIKIAIPFAFLAGLYFNDIINEFKKNPKSKISVETEIKYDYKVSGIAGVFFKSQNPGKLNKWYQDNLGLPKGPFGSRYEWQETYEDSTRMGSFQWSAISDKENYFLPSAKNFMINYRVENLDKLVSQLQKDSIPLLDSISIYPYGKFIHLMDIEGNKIELWEPIDEVFTKMGGATTK